MFNENNYTSGCADLLVRSDYINSLTQYPSLESYDININAKNLKKYHYLFI